MISSEPTIPPHAAFIAFGFPSASYVPIIITGCGKRYGLAPRFTLLIVISPLHYFMYNYIHLFVKMANKQSENSVYDFRHKFPVIIAEVNANNNI